MHTPWRVSLSIWVWKRRVQRQKISGKLHSIIYIPMLDTKVYIFNWSLEISAKRRVQRQKISGKHPCMTWEHFTILPTMEFQINSVFNCNDPTKERKHGPYQTDTYKGCVVVYNVLYSPCVGLGHSFFLHDSGTDFMALTKVW